MSDIRG